MKPVSPILGTKFREGTLGIIGAIGENQGPLQAVRLENTTDAGLESEAAREAQSAVATRSSWVEVRGKLCSTLFP